MIVTATTIEELCSIGANSSLFSVNEEAQGYPSNDTGIHKTSARSVDDYKLENYNQDVFKKIYRVIGGK